MEDPWAAAPSWSPNDEHKVSSPTKALASMRLSPVLPSQSFSDSVNPWGSSGGHETSSPTFDPPLWTDGGDEGDCKAQDGLQSAYWNADIKVSPPALASGDDTSGVPSQALPAATTPIEPSSPSSSGFGSQAICGSSSFRDFGEFIDDPWNRRQQKGIDATVGSDIIESAHLPPTGEDEPNESTWSFAKSSDLVPAAKEESSWEHEQRLLQLRQRRMVSYHQLLR